MCHNFWVTRDSVRREHRAREREREKGMNKGRREGEDTTAHHLSRARVTVMEEGVVKRGGGIN